MEQAYAEGPGSRHGWITVRGCCAVLGLCRHLSRHSCIRSCKMNWRPFDGPKYNVDVKKSTGDIVLAHKMCKIHCFLMAFG